MIKLLLFFSVLGVLIPLLIQSFKPFLMQHLFSYTSVDKSYMFLLCNGILFFIAMTSGLTSPSSPTTNQSFQVAVGDKDKSSRLEFNVSEISAPAPIEGENNMAVESSQEEDTLSDAQEDDEKSLMIVEQEDGEEGNGMMIIDDNDEEDHGHGHGHGAEEAEELNKKCEDFIKKMKAAFISEPRDDHSHHSLLLVN